MMRGNLMLIFCLVICSRFLSGNSVLPRLAPALYVLGDSLFDSGNNNFLATLAKVNYKPYGVNFPTGATGRFTNGRTVADFIAEFLGLPLSPPILSIRVPEILTGLNYASGSCGILPETGKFIGKCLNLDNQLDLFEVIVNIDLTKRLGRTKALTKYLSKSIFIVSIGSNDYINNYLQPNLYDSSRRYSPQLFAQLLTDSLSQKLERLYKLGARKVIVFEIGPVGCIPAVTTQYNHTGKCVDEVNKFVSLYNYQLGTTLNRLRSTLPGSAFVLAHINSLSFDAIQNPSRYGLRDTSNPCCITANGTLCIPNLQPCNPTTDHYFWDGFHLTEPVYSVIAARCIGDPSVCIPTNIKQLLQI